MKYKIDDNNNNNNNNKNDDDDDDDDNNNNNNNNRLGSVTQPRYEAANGLLNIRIIHSD